MRIKLLSLLALLGLAFFAPGRTYGQWKGEVGLSGSLSSGNVDKFDLASEGNITHADSLFEFSAFYAATYGELDNIQNNGELQGGVKFDYRPQSTLSPFLLGTAFQNTFQGVESRLSGLLGMKWLIAASEGYNYSLSGAIQYDSEVYTNDSTVQKLRLSLRPKFGQNIGKLRLKHMTFIRPNIQDFADLLISSETELSTPLSKQVNLTLTYRYNFVSLPPSTDDRVIQTQDHWLLFGLQFKF